MLVLKTQLYKLNVNPKNEKEKKKNQLSFNIYIYKARMYLFIRSHGIIVFSNALYCPSFRRGSWNIKNSLSHDSWKYRVGGIK